MECMGISPDPMETFIIKWQGPSYYQLRVEWACDVPGVDIADYVGPLTTTVEYNSNECNPDRAIEYLSRRFKLPSSAFDCSWVKMSADV